MKHLAWDSGVLNAIGFKPSKTVKTECEKRVAASSIDNDQPTCSDCIQARNQMLEAAEALTANQWGEKARTLTVAFFQ